MRTLTFDVPDDQYEFLRKWGLAHPSRQPVENVAAAFIEDSITQRRNMRAKFADAGRRVDAQLSKGGHLERSDS